LKKHLTHPVFQIISETSSDMGLSSYIIGGFVRDLIMGRPSKDVDIVVSGSGITLAEEVARKAGVQLHVFKNFGTAMLHFENLDVEFVGARKESYREHSRKPVVEDGSMEDDQLRRDFTINAMSISLCKENYGEILDPFQGLSDIEHEIIRTPREPGITFSDDPLRMMRAIRFASQLQFDIEKTALEAIKDNRERIQIVSGERITDELNKIILSPLPSIGFKLLFDTKLLHLIFPQMSNLQGVEYIRGKGHKDNFYHTLQVLDNISKVSDDLWLRWAAILHDIAKPATKRFDEEAGWTFHGHEDKGSRMVSKIFRQLKLPMNEKMKYVEKLVLLHLRPIVLAQSHVTDSAVRRLLFDAGEEIDDLMTLCNADITSKNEVKVKKYIKNFEVVKTKLKEVEEKDQLRNWQPPVSGEDIMKAFQLQPGREVGIIKNHIREAILDGEINNNFIEAYEFMKIKGKEMGLILQQELIQKGSF
jgi:poly(A) polymerase